MALRGESGWQAVHSKAFGKERWQQSMDRCNMLQHCIVSRYQFQKKTALKHDISSSLSLKSINQHCCPKNTTKKNIILPLSFTLFHAGPSQGALGAAAGGPAAAGESPGAAESLPAVIPTPGVGAAAAP